MKQLVMRTKNELVLNATPYPFFKLLIIQLSYDELWTKVSPETFFLL